MNKTRKVGSPKLNIGYVAKKLVAGEPIPLVHRLLEHGNAVRVASVADVGRDVWRLYRPSLNGCVDAFPARGIDTLDALLFTPDALADEQYSSALGRLARRYSNAEPIDLVRFSAQNPASTVSADVFARAIEDHFYRDSHPYSPF